MPIPSYIPAAGITPASAFYPALFNPLGLPATYLADDTGNDGELQSIVLGRHEVDDQVVTAIRSALNSGTALGNTGNRIRTLKKNDGTTASALKFLVDEALKTLVRNRDIGEVTIEADAEDYLGGFYLSYKNLRSGEEAAKSIRTVPLSIK